MSHKCTATARNLCTLNTGKEVQTYLSRGEIRHLLAHPEHLPLLPYGTLQKDKLLSACYYVLFALVISWLLKGKKIKPGKADES